MGNKLQSFTNPKWTFSLPQETPSYTHEQHAYTIEMAPEAPYTVKWGIMATGGIAETFCKDLLTDPATRSVHDVKHQIVAVSSSSSVERAASFIKKIDGPATARAYGSYAELVADSDVDIIYVATPHSHHFQNAMLALEAGKNVLCEKALTVTASQAKKLVAKAMEKNLFFLEAMWTRYFPLSIKIRELISSGEIGTVYRTLGEFFARLLSQNFLVHLRLPGLESKDHDTNPPRPADLSCNENTPQAAGVVNFPDTHRMVSKDLAGGALLDLGVYALTWVFQTLYHVQPSATKEAPRVLAAANQYHTGVDENTSVICHFPDTRAIGVATTSMLVGTSPHGEATAAPAVRIQGSKGEIQVPHPAYRPLAYSVIRKEGDGDVEVVKCPIPTDPARGNWGHGMFWEADECARCLRDGKKQSSTLPWDESIVIMQTMEEALRQGGVEYPELITTDIYDAKSPLNTGNK
ncbi:NADP:D-xylose dehydrogenase [Metarhizium rileyi]|uniref:D-xylose 1-dehydrogenase (NADP(+), D-xylono-1,5-lactone-forming) n=1 Tax=Metarhizium rileyi (strain RCEF 4871) TaxID=1649241 RepID=A0A162JLQ6_METRR|nr:NADP:D-xylose dehydrogenase [Metarhizium rileyi RCEF 4871]